MEIKISTSLYWLVTLLRNTECSAHLLKEHWDVQLDDSLCVVSRGI